MTGLRGPCILWDRAVQSKGYGSETNGRGSSQLVHRRVWEEARGPIPDGMTIDHLCLQKRCMNPDHMEVVTRAENTRRKWERMTHCKRGHELAGSNLRLTERRNGRVHRVCRECATIHKLAHLERRRADVEHVLADRRAA